MKKNTGLAGTFAFGYSGGCSRESCIPLVAFMILLFIGKGLQCQ